MGYISLIDQMCIAPLLLAKIIGIMLYSNALIGQKSVIENIS
jgi:hypothetical protein